MFVRFAFFDYFCIRVDMNKRFDITKNFGKRTLPLQIPLAV